MRREPLPPAIRRIVLLTSAVLLMDTSFYALLSPLLAGYADAAHLGTASVGLLVAAYPLGMVVGSFPAGALTARHGPRAVLASGLAVSALTCVMFATATTGPQLIGYRLLQGFGGALSWTAAFVWASSVAPPARRGEIIGRMLGLAVVGGMLGPVLGAVATVAGATPVFLALGVALAALAAVGGRQPRPAMAESPGWRHAFGLLRDRRVRVGLWLLSLGGIGFGVVNTQAPLTLQNLGLTALATSGVFLAMAASGAVASPWIGRRTDQHGRAPVSVALLVVAAAALLVTGWSDRLVALVPVLVVAATGLEALYVPGSALVVDGTADAEVASGEILSLGNLTWAVGMAVSSLLAGLTSGLGGGAAPYAAVAACALLTVPTVVSMSRGTATVGSRPS